MNKKVICPYCGKEAEIVGGITIYLRRQDLEHRKFWLCRPCWAYVGIHSDSKEKPLGRLADASLRAQKQLAHRAFDRLCQRGVFATRTGAYSFLSHSLNIPLKECHISMFSENLCKETIKICNNKYNEWKKIFFGRNYGSAL